MLFSWLIRINKRDAIWQIDLFDGSFFGWDYKLGQLDVVKPDLANFLIVSYDF